MWCASASIILFALALPGRADDSSVPPIWTQYEFRTGALYHAAGFLGPDTEAGGVDLNIEFLTPRLGLAQDTPWAFLAPRLVTGGTLNFDGKTSVAYAGLAWTLDITPEWFLEPTFGGAIHSGKLDVPNDSGRLSLGCRELFRPGLSSGYRLNENWSVILTWEHISNANLCARNNGLNDLGMKIGFTF
jgi:hypothetical protein